MPVAENNLVTDPAEAELALQVNKAGAPELLRSWRSASKAQPVDLYVGQRRVVHFRNVLFKARQSLSACRRLLRKKVLA